MIVGDSYIHHALVIRNNTVFSLAFMIVDIVEDMTKKIVDILKEELPASDIQAK